MRDGVLRMASPPHLDSRQQALLVLCARLTKTLASMLSEAQQCITDHECLTGKGRPDIDRPSCVSMQA